MARHSRRLPGGAQVLETDFDTFDVEADGPVSREGELDRAFGRHVAGGEGDGEERQHRGGGGGGGGGGATARRGGGGGGGVGPGWSGRARSAGLPAAAAASRPHRRPP